MQADGRDIEQACRRTTARLDEAGTRPYALVVRGRFIRHLLSVAVLPFVVAVLTPAWLARSTGETLGAGGSAIRIAGQLGGGLLLALGATLFVSSLRRFWSDGDGTLAPWDPPTKLVVRGPYRYVCNPMISGVVMLLFAEAAILWSLALLAWAAIFTVANLIHIPLVEEPALLRRFGAAYEAYCRHVPRLLPRLSPWSADRTD